MGNEIVFSQILNVSIQIRTFSLCAERGSENSSTQRWNLFFREKTISTNSVGLSGFCIFFFSFSSFCICMFKIPNFRDD